ncbi:MAG: AAA family ATPase [Nitrospinales bacterium]
MQIRELHIDGFGAFANRQVKGLTSGINVIHGPNEFGKTTLLEFIRRILFGFPGKSQNVNQYPPLNGGTYGGRLVSQLANGEEIIIARTSGPQKGTVTVWVDSRQLHGQENLNAFLGNASKELYQNIFAFTLEELQAFGSLQGEEIKTHIYGVGMGLGAKSIINMADSFRKRCNELFAPRGKTREMSVLLNDIKGLQQEIGEIQDRLARYDDLQSKAGKLKEDKTSQERAAQELETQRRVLETRLDLYPAYVELKEAEEELGRFGGLPDFPEHACETLRGMQLELSNLKNRLDEENENREKLKVERDGISVNEKLLQRQEAVVGLRNMTEQALSILADRPAISEKMDLLKEQIQADINEIDPQWDEDAVAGFEITPAEKDIIEVSQKDLVESQQNVRRAREKLEEHKRQKAEEMSRGMNIPEWLKVVSYGLLGMGAAGLLWGWLISIFPLMAFSLVTLVLGAVSARMIYKRKDTLVKEDRFEPLLVEKLERAQQEEDKKFADWRAWLRKKKLNEHLTPTRTQEAIGTIKRVKALLRQRDELAQRLERMRETLDKAGGLVGEIAPALQTPVLEQDLGPAINLINLAYEEAERNREKRSGLQIQLSALEGKIDRLMSQINEHEIGLQEFFRSLDVADGEDFENKRRQLDKKKLLQNTVDEKRRLIQSRIGLDAAYEQFLQSINETHPEEIQRELDEVTRYLKELQEAKDRVNQEMGEIRNELNQLASEDELLIKQNELGIKNEQLKFCAREWVTCKIAHFMLERAKQKYERERQPEVIRAAENIFSRVTGGRYNKIFKPLDKDEILIDNESGQRRGVVEMSRGTREQLYLAMRLGLIEEYEKRSEPLPVIMDDVLVNFDDERALSLMKILKAFAATRQVIVLSCHHQSLKIYKRLGANQLAV